MNLKHPSFFQKRISKYNIFLCLTFFSIFLVITGISRLTRYIDPNIKIERLTKKDDSLTNTYMGNYVFNNVAYYHIKRFDEIVLIKDIPMETEQPINIVKRFLDEELNQKGWVLSSGFDPGTHDCNFLLPESDMFLEYGFDIHAYRKDSYEPALGKAGDLICLLLIENQDETYIRINIVTAKPTLAVRILKLLSS